MKPTSLLTMDQYEERNLVSTPLSLEACRLEGIEPSELLYRPRDFFKEETVSDEHAELKYKYYEKQRQEALAVVRDRRYKLEATSNRSSRQSKSTGNLFHSGLFNREIERAKDKHLKMITQIMSYEVSASSKLNELQKIENQKEALEQQRQRANQIKLKRIAEEKRQRELELREQELLDQKLAKRQAIKEMQTEMMESMRKAALEEHLQREREKKSQIKELQRKEKRERVEEFLDYQTKMLEDKLKQKFEEEDKRQMEIQRKREELKRKLAMQGAANEQKRRSVLESIQGQMEMRRREFLRKEEKMQQQTMRYRSATHKKIEHLQKQSQQKDIKIQRTKEVAEKQLEEFRIKINQKMAESQLSVEQQRQKQLREIERKKWKEALKQAQRDWNVNRQRKKEEYEMQKLKEELEEKERRTELYLSARDQMIKERGNLNYENDMQKFEIKQAMLRMALTKKWNPTAIEEIVKHPQSSQSFRRPHIASRPHSHAASPPRDEAPPPQFAS